MSDREKKMAEKQGYQKLAPGTMDGLSLGDAEGGIDQRLVSAQNFVVGERRAYQNSLQLRGQVIHLAKAAGWTTYRIAKRLGITRRAVEEALERPVPLTPEQFLDYGVKQNGGHENPDVRAIRDLLRKAASS